MASRATEGSCTDSPPFENVTNHSDLSQSSSKILDSSGILDIFPVLSLSKISPSPASPRLHMSTDTAKYTEGCNLSSLARNP